MEGPEFMRACADGGQRLAQAVRRLVDGLQGPLLRDAAAVLGTDEVSRDLVQDTFVRVWNRCAQYRGDAPLKAWVRRILRHRIIDHLRTRRTEVPLHDEDGEVLRDVESALAAQQSPQALDPSGRLSELQAQRLYDDCFRRFARDHPEAAAAIRWVAEDGLSMDELADILQRSPAATREFVSQCRKKARRHLAPWYALMQIAEA